MGKLVISGIQQIGIGIPNVHDAFKWYRQNFGMDVPIFDEAAEANLMLPYTGGKPHARHAILAINMQGGGGFEIWQYVSRTPQPPVFTPQIGDLGIYAAKIKCKNVNEVYKAFKKKGINVVGDLHKDPAGNPTFFVTDPYGNHFQMVVGDTWYKNQNKLTGGPAGAVLGSTNIENSRKLYSDILGYDTVVYDETGHFSDLAALPGGEGKFRRVLLKHSKPRVGSFSKVFGPSEIELVQVLDSTPRKIYENRFWGDLGFIHLCFDINGMQTLKELCESKGFPFTVDSANSFDMGEAAGHFTYIEDPDGTLIEFVETHKIPILKKLNWYFDLTKRDPEKNMPDWMLSAISLTRVKD